MKFQYIRASFSPQGRTYLMPETLTRYYYRKDIVLEHSDHTIEIDYPFAFELFIDGQLIPARTGEKMQYRRYRHLIKAYQQPQRRLQDADRHIAFPVCGVFLHGTVFIMESGICRLFVFIKLAGLMAFT